MKNLPVLYHVYSNKNLKEVEDFVQKNYLVLNALNEAEPELKEIFGNNVGVSLWLLSDPEDDRKVLMACIDTSLNVSEAREKMKRFNREWWHATEKDIPINFNFNFAV